MGTDWTWLRDQFQERLRAIILNAHSQGFEAAMRHFGINPVVADLHMKQKYGQEFYAAMTEDASADQ